MEVPVRTLDIDVTKMTEDELEHLIVMASYAWWSKVSPKARTREFHINVADCRITATEPPKPGITLG